MGSNAVREFVLMGILSLTLSTFPRDSNALSMVPCPATASVEAAHFIPNTVRWDDEGAVYVLFQDANNSAHVLWCSNSIPKGWRTRGQKTKPNQLTADSVRRQLQDGTLQLFFSLGPYDDELRLMHP